MFDFVDRAFTVLLYAAFYIYTIRALWWVTFSEDGYLAKNERYLFLAILLALIILVGKTWAR